MLGVRAFFSHLFFCGVVVICFILQRVAPVTMEMDSRSIVSEDITGALLLCCKGEFILAKHRKGERKMFLYVRVCVWKSVLGLPHKWIFIACYVRRWQKRLVFDGFYDHFFSYFFFTIHE